MAERVRPFALLGLTFVLAVCIRSEFLRFLLGFEVMLYAGLYAELVYLSRRLTARLTAPADRCRVGDGLVFDIELTNRSPLPMPAVLVRAAVRDYPDPEELLLKGRCFLDGRESGRVRFTLDDTHCASLRLRIDAVYLRDRLGLFRRRVPLSADSERVCCLLPVPSQDSTDVCRTGYVSDEDSSLFRRGTAVSDISDIRPYRPGDSLRRLHRKLSARMDTLMILESADPVQKLTRVVLMLQDDPRADRGAWDRFLARLAALSLTLLTDGREHIVLWQDDELRRPRSCRVADRETHEQMLCLVLGTARFAPPSLSDLHKETPGYESTDEQIEINLQGDLVRTGRPG